MILSTVNLTSWADRWALAGMSVLTVFLILVILVFVLQIFSAIAKRGSAVSAHAKHAGDAASAADASETDKVAIAVTLHLHFSAAHDVESGILTINTDTASLWHGDVEQN